MKNDLTFKEYCNRAKTDNSRDHELAFKYSVDMLLDEATTIYRFYSTSKTLEDGNRYLKNMIPNKAGDILWYMNNLCSLLGISLDEIANQNLEKINARWGENDSGKDLCYDDGFPPFEQLPKKITFIVQETYVGDKEKNIPPKVVLSYQVGSRLHYIIGDDVDDNSRSEDYYRYHDIFHISYYAHLGWSAVLRRLMKKKRKSVPVIDRAEDGGRAGDLEEAMTSFIYMHSKKFIIDQREPQKLEVVDFRTYRTIERLISGLEVRSRSRELWLDSIYNAIKCMRFAIKHRGCAIDVDLELKKFEYYEIPNELK